MLLAFSQCNCVSSGVIDAVADPKILKVWGKTIDQSRRHLSQKHTTKKAAFLSQ